MAQVDVSLLKPGAKGDGWSVNGSVLTINEGAQIEFINGKVGFITFNNGTILGGTFNGPVANYDGATISGGIFKQQAINVGTISGGEFYTEVYQFSIGVIKNLIAKNGFYVNPDSTAGFSTSQLKSLRDNIANSVDYTKLSAQSLNDIKAIQDTAVNVDAIVEKLKAIKEIITIIKDTFIDYAENKNAQNTDLELIAQSQNSNDNLL